MHAIYDIIILLIIIIGNFIRTNVPDPQSPFYPLDPTLDPKLLTDSRRLFYESLYSILTKIIGQFPQEGELFIKLELLPIELLPIELLRIELLRIELILVLPIELLRIELILVLSDRVASEY